LHDVSLRRDLAKRCGSSTESRSSSSESGSHFGERIVMCSHRRTDFVSRGSTQTPAHDAHEHRVPTKTE